MNHKYINAKTFEITDEVFEVDEDIATTISLLNKKGYYTKYSCTGHVKDPRLYELYKLENVGEFKSLGYIVDDNNILMPYTYTSVYIMFDNNYNFNNLPEGFYVSDDDNCIISCEIYYYDSNLKRKSANIIDEEIKTANTKLLKWANDLPNNN